MLQVADARNYKHEVVFNLEKYLFITVSRAVQPRNTKVVCSSVLHRKCEDVGRSVVARGLWCDIVCSPYHTFGVTSEESSLLEVSNKQFKHTAVEIARHNVHAFLRELRGEEKATMAASLSGAKPSRGPTTAEACS